jgi:dTDP-4-amino-4,6-dideoxygalactose transaminase
MGQRLGNQRDDCPVAEAVSDGLLRLPFYNDLTEADQSQVVAAVKSFDS